MDCGKVGRLIFSLRSEKRMTQKQLADALNISDKTISKWERGLGCPDVTLLQELSGVLGVNIGQILSGDMEASGVDRGNLKKLKFYVCPVCGNTITSTSEPEISCCGRILTPLMPKQADEAHRITVEEFEDERYITSGHGMSKGHYISFIAAVDTDRVYLIKLYPEQDCAARLPAVRGGKLFWYCTEHGLWTTG